MSGRRHCSYLLLPSHGADQPGQSRRAQIVGNLDSDSRPRRHRRKGLAGRRGGRSHRARGSPPGTPGTRHGFVAGSIWLGMKTGIADLRKVCCRCARISTLEATGAMDGVTELPIQVEPAYYADARWWSYAMNATGANWLGAPRPGASSRWPRGARSRMSYLATTPVPEEGRAGPAVQVGCCVWLRRGDPAATGAVAPAPDVPPMSSPSGCPA